MHVLWNKKFKVESVFICYSPYLEIKEIYNIVKDRIQLRDHCIHIDDHALEVNGYIGLVLKSKILDLPYVVAPITIEVIWSSGTSEKIERKIILFRPYIVVRYVPSVIIIRIKGNELKVDKRIGIRNEGYGTAIVKFEIDPSSNVEVTKPKDIEEYINGFCDQLVKELKVVKEHFPQYSSIISDFEKLMIEFAKGTFPLTEESLSYARKTSKLLVDAMKIDDNFAKEFLSAIIGAYIVVINILTEFRALLEYIRSIVENRVLLVNAMHMLKLEPGINVVKGRIYVHDLAGNVYKPIDIEVQINVISSRNIAIPVYELFQWGEGNI